MYIKLSVKTYTLETLHLRLQTHNLSPRVQAV